MPQYVPKFILYKKTQNTYAVVGQTLIYSINVSNDDTIPFTNIVIYDVLDAPLSFKEGSVKVEGMLLPNANVFAGVPIGSLLPGTKKTVTFEATVLNRDNLVAVNQAIARFNYQPVDGPVLANQVASNSWEVKLYLAEVEVIKTADKQEVNLGDEIAYTVKLGNIGDLPANGVCFTDILPPQIELVEGSVKVQGEVVNGVELDKGIFLGKILPRESTMIQYTTKVIKANCSGLLTNQAHATFRYELPFGDTGVLEGEPVAVTTYTKLNINTFKQLSIEAYLYIPEVKPCIETLNTVTGTIDVKGCHVLKTPQMVSEEKQILTGYKVIIYSILNVVIEYTALGADQKVHSAHYDVPFSTFVMLPPDYEIGSKLDISGVVEDIYYQAIDMRCFFTNVSALINVKILGC
ncbi:MAG: DUF3794 domain-containing protein [Niameybacter sp.]